MSANARDIVTLTIGFGVLPLAWLVWTSPVLRSWPLAVIIASSLVWVPAGFLLLVLWFHDNPASNMPGIRWLWRRLHSSKKLAAVAFPLTTVALFFTLLSLSLYGPDLTGFGLTRAGDKAFFAGLFTVGLGLVVASSWLGRKEDYSRTAHITGVSGSSGNTMVRPLPRASPGAQPTERQRENSRLSGVLVDLFGFSVIVAGVLLMSVSSLL